MKSMTCKQLGGYCEKKFSTNTFDEIAHLAKPMEKKCFKLMTKVTLMQ